MCQFCCVIDVISWISQNSAKLGQQKLLIMNYACDVFEGYYMAVRRYEISLQASKNISQVSEANDWNIFNTSREIWSITVNKANNLLALIKRSVGTTNVNVFSTLCLSPVQPILEYSVPICCPYLVKDIRALDSIQRRASRLALNQHKGEMPYVDHCKLLKWPLLSDRRNYLSLIECYKFVFGYYHFNFYDFFEFSKVGSTRANHPFKLYAKSARLDC